MSKKTPKIEENIMESAVGTVAVETTEEEMAANVDAVMKKFDRESNTRIWEGAPKWVVTCILAAFSLFCIYVTLFATWLEEVRLTSFVALIVMMGYIVFPAKKGVQKVNRMPWYDILIMVLGTGAFLYFTFNAHDIIKGGAKLEVYQIVIAIIGIAALAELCRRCVGLPILIVAGAFIIYALVWGLKNPAFTGRLNKLVYDLFYTKEGILSTPINACSKFIVVFIIFGAFLERTGIADFFIKIANVIVGRFSGGPAKVAVVASALEGMVSGSSVANTVGSGSITIPLMKKTGYKPEFAAAAEASASTGGQIMPPIMGAAAFLMAENLNIGYGSIIVKAILPAVLYFAGVFIAVHLEAKKYNLRGLTKEEIPAWKPLVKKIYLLIPMVLLIYLVGTGTRTIQTSATLAIIAAVIVSLNWKLAIRKFIKRLYLYIPMCLLASLIGSKIGALAGFHALVGTSTLCIRILTGVFYALVIGAIIVALIINLFSKENRVMPKRILEALAAGAQGTISVAVACAIAGIIAGTITSTGLANILINGIVALAGKQVIIALVLTMLCCIVLGMGVPTTANYCIMAATCAPILTQMGIPPIAAHFFVFYFGIVADLTPPVALAAYAGAAIAQSNPIKTAITSTKLAIGAFIVPYVFALNPTMLFVGNPGALEIILIVISSIIGIFAVSAALEGYFLEIIPWYQRIICAVGGLLLIYPGIVTDSIGLGIVALITLLQVIARGKAKKLSA